jgi:hypothetical protein
VIPVFSDATITLTIKAILVAYLLCSGIHGCVEGLRLIKEEPAFVGHSGPFGSSTDLTIP